MIALSIICLAITGGLCAAAIFANSYRDNWWQFVGLVSVCYWCVGRIPIILERGYVYHENTLLHVGMACFAIGTAWKVWNFRDCSHAD